MMTMITGMDNNVDDEDLKEEIMRCFSNAPTTIQAIAVREYVWHYGDNNDRVTARWH